MLLPSTISYTDRPLLILFQKLKELNPGTMRWTRLDTPDDSSTEAGDEDPLFSETPEGMLELCLSDKLSFMVKIQSLDDLPVEMYEVNGDMLWLEEQLEGAGKTQLAQCIRYWSNYLNGDMEYKWCDEEQFMWCRKIIEADIERRWIAQRRIYLCDKIEITDNSIDTQAEAITDNNYEVAQQISDMSGEARRLSEQYLICKRKIWKLECDIPEGPLSRSFHTLRKNPKWYLSTWLRRDCAGRGGCCGRNCGCCEKPREINENGKIVDVSHGHCATTCHCCIRSRGFTGDSSLDDMKDFPIELCPEGSGYTWYAIRAYIWGVDFLNDLETKKLKTSFE
ncbi:hypothetical protein PHISP_05570 [Aspergillus sp. HF37]|nr:hypothetical protein PHISP_05570 [Aspergillus sp. HF37]